MQVNLLCSRHYLNKKFALLIEWLRERDALGKVYIDSGAFTDWKKGRDRPVQEYADWLMDLAVPYDRYLAKNVIGDHRQTLANLTWMAAQGYNPIPVWQPGMTASDVRYLYELAEQFDGEMVVAMGGDPGRGWQQEARRALDEDWPAALGYTQMVHLLGLTDTRILKKWKPYSADASSWGAGLRFGYCKSYVPGKLKLGAKIKRGEAPHAQLVEFMDLLEIPEQALTPEAFKQAGGVSLAAQITLCAHLWFVNDLAVGRVSRLFLSHHPSLWDLLSAPFDPLGRVRRALDRRS